MRPLDSIIQVLSSSSSPVSLSTLQALLSLSTHKAQSSSSPPLPPPDELKASALSTEGQSEASASAYATEGQPNVCSPATEGQHDILEGFEDKPPPPCDEGIQLDLPQSQEPRRQFHLRSSEVH
ncbi:hypothetical protein ATANTOWER_019191 [Ataeniobius toweri]|uniref:Uncharacterized protein n=1 Tax=Ataeniobius toweri TaxID=208326 RepID=A0ABU7A754_9TELE|nr:hypothetical protein [Ataeniobius toweri]